MPTPQPGHQVRGSRTGKPLMALLDLLGRRWALRVLWELRQGPLNFRDLRGRCDGMSPSVLNARLRELREADVVAEPAEGGYRLTARGRELLRDLEPLDRWSRKWRIAD